MKAAIVFTDETEHWLARRLRPGFRHVFCAVPSIHDDGTSIVVNVTVHGTEVIPLNGTPDDLAVYYRSLGLVAFTVAYTPAKRPLLPLILNNCVGLTKQTVGINSRAFTPFQLWQHVKEQACVSISHSPVLEAAASSAAQPPPLLAASTQAQEDRPQRLHLHLPKSLRRKRLST